MTDTTQVTDYEAHVSRAKELGAKVTQHEIGFSHDEFARFLALSPAPAAPAPQREPLSADRIRAVQAQHYKRHELADCTYETRLDIEAFARAIERAHGIGAKEPPHDQ